MTTRQQQLKILLISMEAELRSLELWSDEAPPARDLASTEPFCVDTLSLSQWLQWLLIPRMHELLRAGHPLPNNCNISAIAEESFKELEQDCTELLRLIAAFDRTLALPH